MNKVFKEMLIQAEKIRAECRRTGAIGPHARQMMRMINYGRQRGLFTGTFLDRSMSPEYLTQAAEAAACILEVIHDEPPIGSVLRLSVAEQYALSKRAAEKAQAHIRAVEASSARFLRRRS